MRGESALAGPTRTGSDDRQRERVSILRVVPATNRMSSPKPSDRSSRSLATRAYRGIKEDILTGRLHPGEMILEPRLAETYRMSRTPIHEALKTLAKDGLVQVIPRVGYVISQVTVNDVYEIFQCRLVLETTAIELAAPRVTDDDITILRRFGRGTRSSTRRGGDARAFGEASAAHRDFHLMVASLSGNRRLVDMIAQLLDESQRILALDPLNLQQLDLMSATAHGPIIKALTTRKPTLAADEMAAHVAQAQARITNALLPEHRPKAGRLGRLAKLAGTAATTSNGRPLGA
jgi:DNA-binding GntR family transcriptional regulator